jgi:hypothetical protein
MIEKFEHARRAKNRLDELIASEFGPLLRSVTGNTDLKVEATGGAPATDGKTVWLQVPWKLGETLEHDTAKCAVKDDELLSLCPACRVVDEVSADMWHESAHITEDSFQKMTQARLWKLIRDNFSEEIDALDSAKQYELERKVRGAISTLEGFRAIDSWALLTWNVIEDIYVNRRLYAARPGVEPGMQATTRASFLQGTALKRPRDMTALMVPYIMGHGLAGDPDVVAYFDAEFKPLFDDDKIQEIVGDIPTDSKIDDRLVLSIALLKRLRELGFLPRNEDSLLEEPPTPPPPPPSEDEGDPEPGEGEQGDEPEPAEADDESDDASDGDGSDEAEASDDESEDKDDEAEADTGDGAEGDDDEDQESEDDGASGEGEAEDADEDEESEGGSGGEASDEDADDDEGEDDASGDGSSDDTQDGGDDDEAGDDADDGSQGHGMSDSEIEDLVDQIERSLEEAMGHDRNDDLTHGQKEIMQKSIDQCDFDEPAVHLQGLKVVGEREFLDMDGYNPYYAKPPTHIKPNEGLVAPALSHLRVVFAENKHSHMRRDLRRGPRLDTRHLHRAAGDDRRIFGRKDIPKQRDWSVVVGVDFTSSNCSNGAMNPVKEMALTMGELLQRLGIRFTMEVHSGSRGMIYHAPIKGFNEPWNKDSHQKINLLDGRGGNYDGRHMERYRKLAQAERATDKLIIFVTDGELHGSGAEGKVLTNNIELCRRLGIQLVAVSHQNESPAQMGFDTIRFDGPQDLPKVVAGLDKHLSQ